MNAETNRRNPWWAKPALVAGASATAVAISLFFFHSVQNDRLKPAGSKVSRSTPAVLTVAGPGPLQLAISQVFLGRAAEAVERGNLAEAVIHYSDALAADPKNAGIYYMRGALFWHMNQAGAAIADMTQAIRLQGRPQYYVSRCGAYFALGEWDSAISDCTESIRMAPMEIEARFLRAASYYSKGDMERAMADSLTLLMLRPGDPNAKQLVDQILEEQEARKRAVSENAVIRTGFGDV